MISYKNRTVLSKIERIANIHIPVFNIIIKCKMLFSIIQNFLIILTSIHVISI